jgi:hypothetical protein
MNELHKALDEITSIRRQVARTAEFRGYGPATLATTGGLALAAAGLQALILPNPTSQPSTYLAIWILTAAVSASLIAAQTYTRSRRMHSGMADEMIQAAVEQFLPSVAAGALLTLVIIRAVPSAFWMLPGLWQIIFSLGVFSSCRFLPRPMAMAGAWYLLTGIVYLNLADARALGPWAMGLPFGVGQLLVAAILYLSPTEVADEA